MITKFLLRILIAVAVLLVTAFVLTLLKWQYAGEVFIAAAIILAVAIVLFRSIE